MWDSVRLNFKDRFLNVGSAEMAMMGTAIGLALDGKIPIVYSITPFALYRPFEMIRNYINHEKIKVHIVGGGRNTDYGYLGFSHWATEDQQVMKIFNNIEKNANLEYELVVLVAFFCCWTYSGWYLNL